MNANENYRIEEIEDAAVKKSNMAKTVGIAAGMGVLGAGAAVAANAAMDHETPDDKIDTTPETGISTEELVEGATQGADNTTVVVNETKTETVVKPAPEPKEPETSLTVDEQTVVVDEDGNTIASQTTGTLEGKQYTAIDTDGDGLVDEIYYDVNGNGTYEANEGGKLAPEDQFAMSGFGQATHTEVHHVYDTPEDVVVTEPDDNIDRGQDEELGRHGSTDDSEDQNDDLGDIDNDLDDDLPGADEEEPKDIAEVDETEDFQTDPDDTYENDYADNNEDYNNDADISDFA